MGYLLDCPERYLPPESKQIEPHYDFSGEIGLSRFFVVLIVLCAFVCYVSIAVLVSMVQFLEMRENLCQHILTIRILHGRSNGGGGQNNFTGHT